jgi:heat shock protein HtpX
MAKRIFLFILLNFLVIAMVSFVLNLFNVRPYLSQYGIDYPSLMVFCLVWGMGGAFVSLALSRVMAKWAMGVKIIDPHTTDSDLRELLQTVRCLARDAGVPMPQVGVYQSNEVNAFATGPTRKRSLVAVSSGLIQRMKNSDVRAVLAHEISHIANGDMVTMTLLQGVVNAFVMFLARILAYVFSGIGRNNRDSSSSGSYMSYVLFVYLFDFVFMILGSLLIAAYSRMREYRADAGGARLAGREDMISALNSLRVLHKISDPHTENVTSFNSFKISASGKKGLFHLFAAHPPLEDRIERLSRMSL